MEESILLKLTTLFMRPIFRLCDPHVEPEVGIVWIWRIKTSPTQATLAIEMQPIVLEVRSCKLM
jgi:hypothetical protein